MLETSLRQAASVLLDSAIRIAPPGARDWGEAIRRELSYVESPWAAVGWALGGAGVMAKQALASLFVPGRRRGIAPGDELFAKNTSSRKAALVAGAGCVLAALLFFAAPPFRQAFQVALQPWRSVYRIASRNIQPGFEALAQRAEAQHDPEGLAFCAVRLHDADESARLAEEAVQLDPKLLWVYAVVGMRHPELAEIGQWTPALERSDPQNGLFPLISAESIERTHFRHGVWTRPTEEQDQAWRSAMAAAFRSAKFDDYLDRVAELNRRVVPRYGFFDPYEVESREELDLPVSVFQNSERFAQSLLRSGAELDARGDPNGAREKYWMVARFGQMLDAQASSAFEHWMGTSLQSMAYKQLQASFVKQGDPTEAALYAYLAAKFEPVNGEHPGLPGQTAFGVYTAERNAAIVQLSGLMMLIFAGLLVAGASILIVGSGQNSKTGAQRANPVATLVVLSSAVGLLFSSATLYLTYRPYWYIVQSAIQSGAQTSTRDLRNFLVATQAPPGFTSRFYLLLDSLLYSGSPTFLFYFWGGVTLLGIIGLVLILLRHFRRRTAASGLQRRPHVP